MLIMKIRLDARFRDHLLRSHERQPNRTTVKRVYRSGFSSAFFLLITLSDVHSCRWILSNNLEDIIIYMRKLEQHESSHSSTLIVARCSAEQLPFAGKLRERDNRLNASARALCARDAITCACCPFCGSLQETSRILGETDSQIRGETRSSESSEVGAEEKFCLLARMRARARARGHLSKVLKCFSEASVLPLLPQQRESPRRETLEWITLRLFLATDLFSHVRFVRLLMDPAKRSSYPISIPWKRTRVNARAPRWNPSRPRSWNPSSFDFLRRVPPSSSTSTWTDAFGLPWSSPLRYTWRSEGNDQRSTRNRDQRSDQWWYRRVGVGLLALTRAREYQHARGYIFADACPGDMCMHACVSDAVREIITHSRAFVRASMRGYRWSNASSSSSASAHVDTRARTGPTEWGPALVHALVRAREDLPPPPSFLLGQVERSRCFNSERGIPFAGAERHPFGSAWDARVS